MTNLDILLDNLGFVDHQFTLPLALPADVHVYRSTEDRDVRELVAELVEDIQDGPIEYNMGYNHRGENVCGLPLPKRRMSWWRFTMVPTIDDESIHVEGWVDRPRHEAPFDPKQGTAA